MRRKRLNNPKRDRFGTYSIGVSLGILFTLCLTEVFPLYYGFFPAFMILLIGFLETDIIKE